VLLNVSGEDSAKKLWDKLSSLLGNFFLDLKLHKKDYSPSVGLAQVAQATEEAGQQSEEK
jgi:hypothetical protein